MDVLGAHLCAHDSGVGGVHENIRMAVLSDLAVEVARVQDTCELRPSVQRVWTKILVQFLQALELQVLGHT